MGLRSWKKEYYPTKADSAAAQKDDVARVKHSLRKWKGLRPKALKKHGVELDGLGNVRNGNAELGVDAESCSLCVAYYKEGTKCRECPFTLVHFGRMCVGDDLVHGEYLQFLHDHDPEPMIAGLEKALEFVQKRKAFQAKKGKA